MLEEEVIVTIFNGDSSVISLRPFERKKTRIFRFELDYFFNNNVGCRTSVLNGKKVLMVEPYQIATAKIVFAPVDSDTQYNSSLDLLIDETDIIKIHVKGMGTIYKFT